MKLQSITENRSIQFTGFSSYGDVTVYIDNKKYEYITDAVYHNRWRKLARYRPWDVLNDIKLQVKNGHATQVQPPPAMEAKTPTAVDRQYAKQFFSTAPSGMEQAMGKIIKKSLPKGEIYTIAGDTSGKLSERDKLKLSAYRVLAADMGITIGQWVYRSRSNSAGATIS